MSIGDRMQGGMGPSLLDLVSHREQNWRAHTSRTSLLRHMLQRLRFAKELHRPEYLQGCLFCFAFHPHRPILAAARGRRKKYFLSFLFPLIRVQQLAFSFGIRRRGACCELRNVIQKWLPRWFGYMEMHSGFSLPPWIELSSCGIRRKHY